MKKLASLLAASGLLALAACGDRAGEGNNAAAAQENASVNDMGAMSNETANDMGNETTNEAGNAADAGGKPAAPAEGAEAGEKPTADEEPSEGGK